LGDSPGPSETPTGAGAARGLGTRPAQRASYAYHVRVYGDHERHRQRYVIEKLHMAVSTLVGTGSVRERLAEAYLRHLSSVSAKDFPEELREEYRAIITALSEVPVEYEVRGTLRSSLNAMSAKASTKFSLTPRVEYCPRSAER
jgi:hypothetical protein